MGKGSSGSQTSTVYNSSLPQYAKPYYTDLMTRALGESKRPYQQYEGQRIADQSDATQAGLGMASNYANSSTAATQGALNTSQDITNQALNSANYQSGAITSGYNAGTYNPNTNFNADQITWADGSPVAGVNQVQSRDFDQAAAQQYMSPYMQDVVNKSKLDAANNYYQADALRQADVGKTGAFGGSRAAVQQQIAQNDLMNRLTGIDVQGAQDAYTNAQQQFNADRNASIGVQTTNQNAAQGILSGNRDASLQAQQLAEQSRQYGFNANESAAQNAAQMQTDAQKYSEQFRQSGQQLNLSALGLAQQGADQTTKIQQSYDQMMLDRIKAQLGVGQTQDDYTQRGLDMAYDDFVNQRDAQRQNLQFYSSLLQGVPVSANQNVVQTSPSNPIAGAAGTLTGLQALYALGQQ